MQNRQNGRRRRSSGSSNPRPMGQAMGGQSANRLEVRVRGNAHQLHEKYKVMARDAHQAGDRVAAEYYLQHADHYFRVLNDARIRQEEMRARRSGFDRYEEENDVTETTADGSDDGGKAVDDSNDDRAAIAEMAESDTVERRPRGRQPRQPRTPRLRSAGDPAPSSDGEEALMAFGGAPARDIADSAEEEEAPEMAPVILTLGLDPVSDKKSAARAASTAKSNEKEAAAAEAAIEPAEEKPVVRRRGRPRKTPVEPVAEA